jgi:hypothetical protein
MTAEEILAAQLEHQLFKLKMGTRHLFLLRQRVLDRTGRDLPGDEHIAGWVLRSPEALTIKFLDTAAGRSAKALVADEILDAVVGSDGRLRLVAGPEPPVTVRFADLQVQRREVR